jgi:UPF0716 family protein affecting phage T7 exclusion
MAPQTVITVLVGMTAISAGLCPIDPGLLTDIIGIVVPAVIAAYQSLVQKKA